MKMDMGFSGYPGVQTSAPIGGSEDRRSAVAAFERWQREHVASVSKQKLQGLLGERRPATRKVDLQS